MYSYLKNFFNLIKKSCWSVKIAETFLLFQLRIGHSQRYSKKAKWDFLRKLMITWSDMVETEQTFLIEVSMSLDPVFPKLQIMKT